MTTDNKTPCQACEEQSSTCDNCRDSVYQGYPAWVCGECGTKYGRHPCGIATFHKGICGICGEEKSVTQPRDFGGLVLPKKML